MKAYTMLLTSLQHRKIARLLRQNATKFPPEKRDYANQMAGLHMGMARAQEENPHLAPAAKKQKLSDRPTEPIFPRIVGS